MSDINDIVDVSISATPSAVTQEGFGIALILGAHLKGTARYNVYSTLAALAAVHPSTTEIYKAAAKYFGQSPTPEQVAVGRRQVDTATVVIDTAVDDVTYTITLNGTAFPVAYDDASPTVAEIATAMRAAINAGAEPITASGSGASVILTHDVPGTAWTLAIDSRMSLSTLVSVDTIAEDLTEIQLESRDWYGLIMTDRTSANFQAAIDWVATVRKVLFFATQESDAANVANSSDSTSLPAILQDESQGRAFGLYHADITTYPDAAAAGRLLPYPPGTYTAKFKELTGIAVSSLTDTQVTNIKAKNCNVYESIGGRSMMHEGVMSSGLFFDQVHGRDWLQARIEEEVFAILSGAAKVPYTDAGVALVENALKGVLQEGVEIGYLSSYETSVPLVADISTTNKGLRLLPDVRFTAVEAGAIHNSTITGVISV